MSEVSDQTPDNDVSDEVEVKDKKRSDSVSYDSYQRLLRQKKSSDKEMETMRQQLNELMLEKESAEEEKLKEQKKFEELYSKAKGDLEKVNSEKENYKKSLLDTYKLQAVLDKLPAKPKKSEYLTFIDLDKVQMTDDGIDLDSVEEVANKFLADHGELLNRKSKDLPSDAPSGGSKDLTFEAWEKLPLKERRANMHRVVNNE